MMQMEHHVEGRFLVVKLLDSRLDAAVATAFKGSMVDLIGKGHTNIILDMTSISFLDSCGLGALVSCLKTIGREGRLSLCGIQPPVMSLFTLTRMHKVFAIHGTLAEALASS